MDDIAPGISNVHVRYSVARKSPSPLILKNIKKGVCKKNKPVVKTTGLEN